ncbi:MAG: phosphoribosyltransferase family protein [Pseudomonadota bacterium]
MSTFVDRQDAGQRLAEAVEKLGLADPVVLALPRGGVPVAAALAERLKAPLDVLLARKIGAPGEPEFAIGAVVDGAAPATVLHQDTIDRLAISREYIDKEIARQLAAIADRRRLYSGADAPFDLTGKDAVIVDDGIATGATIEAAMKAVRQSAARQIVLAVPVAPAKTIARLRGVADQIVCLSAPRVFGAVGAHYADFRQVADDQVKRLLRQARS